MKPKNFYASAHLFVATIRVLAHQNHVPPSIEMVCKALSISEERGHHISRKLSELEIIEVISGAYGTKLFVKDHLAIEEIPQGDTDSKFDEALKKFQDSKKDLSRKVASIQANQKEKKRKLFSDLEKQFKKSKKDG